MYICILKSGSITRTAVGTIYSGVYIFKDM